MKKIILITIVITILFIIGCKDEAEIKDKGWKIKDGDFEIYKAGIAITGDMFPKPEPNEPECKHENKRNSYCLVYHGAGVICEQCLDCGKYIITEPNEPTIEDVIKVNQEIEALEEKIKEKDRILQKLSELNDPAIFHPKPTYLEDN